jgi:Cof subfamily protein (haloacid dehalogenase superfamily)
VRRKLVAIDVDGTLVGDDLIISAADRKAIESATRSGWIVCLASGRLYAASRPFAQQLGLEGPIIVLQGAVGYDLDSGERLFCTPVERPLALAAYDFLKTRGFHMQLYYGDRLYLDAMNRWAEYYLRLSRVEPIVVSDLRALLSATPPADPGPLKVLAITEPTIVAATIPDLRRELGERANVFRSLPPFLEVTDPAANKGEALRTVASLLGVDLADTAAIGDADNDIPMFRTAARSFVVSNGSEAAIASAQIIVGQLGQGVAEALRLLEEERTREPA